MNELATSLMGIPVLAALVALQPKSYLIRLGMAAVAFSGAMSSERVVARVIGFAWLLIAGAGFLIMGARSGTVVDLLIGLSLLGAAGYSWWFTRA